MRILNRAIRGVNNPHINTIGENTKVTLCRLAAMTAVAIVLGTAANLLVRACSNDNDSFERTTPTTSINDK